MPKFGLQGRNCCTACHCYGTTVHRSVGDCLLVSYRSIVIVIKIVAPPPTSLMITITIQHARQ